MKLPNIQYVAVKALIKNDEGEVLVLKQSDYTITAGGQYHPPGGIVELGESLEACVTREVKEEIGVDAEVVRLVGVGEWRAERGDVLMQFVGLFYECRIASNDFRLQGSEISDVAWVGPRDIDKYDVLEPSKSMIKKLFDKDTHD